MGQLDDKVVVITGAGRGLGRAFAEACCEAGARVIIAELVADWGAATAEALTGAGHQAEFIPLDLADPDSVKALGPTVGDKYGRIDGLVNNGALATGLGGKGFEELEIETWDKVMTINVRGTWLATRSCAPYLRKSAHGKVVNLASDTALWGASFLMHYVASKGAVIGMTRAMARELGPDGIAVNAIAPGLTRVAATETVPPERHELYETMRAMPGAQYPETVTGTVVYLLSDGANFVTGTLIPVNGGFVFN